MKFLLCLLITGPVFACQKNWDQDLCHWYKAREAFNKKDYTLAENYYAQISNTEEFWPKTLIERAWSNYYLKNYNKALGLISTLKFPLLKRYELPESYYLEALIYFELCYFGDALKVVDQFVLNVAPKFQTDFITFKDQYFKAIEQTMRVTKKQYSPKVIDNYVQYFKKNFEITEEHMQILKVETLSFARKNLYQNKMLDKRSRGSDFMIRRQNNQHFYEFKEEFWADELGGFVYALEGQCEG